MMADATMSTPQTEQPESRRFILNFASRFSYPRVACLQWASAVRL